MGELVLFNSDETDNQITADLDAGYDVMYSQLEESYGSEEEAKAELCRVIEATIFQEIQNRSEGDELHRAIAELIMDMQETGEVDVDALTQNSVHQLTQLSD